MSDTAVAPARSSPKQRPSIPWAVLSSVAMAIALIVLVATHQPVEDTAESIGDVIRCPVCQGVPISQSPAPMAQDMMAILRDDLATGATREEAIDSLLGAYPGSLLLDTPVSGSTLALWLVPAAALAIGLGLAFTIRRSRGEQDRGAEREELSRRIQQVRSDLDELATQVASGEVDHEAAAHLRSAYQAELAEAEHARDRALSETRPANLPRSRRRTVVGAAVLVSALAGIVALAGVFITERPDGASGVAEAMEGDPAGYSNETLAAVIAANQDHPMIDGMRLALAERYFQEGDYQGAFPYYLEVAQSERATDTQAATALTRLGWMAYDGNGEAETALDLFAEASSLAPDDPFPRYLDGVVTWCGLGRPEEAAEAFRAVLDRGVTDEAVRTRIQNDLAAAEAGEPCST